jgi:hypothetical protein
LESILGLEFLPKEKSGISTIQRVKVEMCYDEKAVVPYAKMKQSPYLNQNGFKYDTKMTLEEVKEKIRIIWKQVIDKNVFMNRRPGGPPPGRGPPMQGPPQ